MKRKSKPWDDVMKDAKTFLKGKERVNTSKKDFDKVLSKAIKKKKG